jgi:hypothetical protein
MRLLALLLPLVLLAGCSSNTGGTTEGAVATAMPAQFEQRLTDKSQFGRLVIAHVNLGKPSRAYLAEHEGRIDRLLAERLRAAGYEVLPTTHFENAWREGLRKWGEPYNPGTGKLNVEILQLVMGETVSHLAANTNVQAIVFTNLEEQQVYFSPTGNHNAHFLGVTRKPASRGGDGVPAGFDWIQGVDAVGIYVKVFDLKLNPLFSGAGGIEVTETLDLKGSTPRWMRSKKILANDDFIAEGLNLATRPWLPAQ